MESVSVIGLGKLGAPLAACVASRGFSVIGVDVDAAKVDAMNQGRAPVFEPGLEKLIQECAGRLKAATAVESAVAASEITFIVVATPSEPEGGFSLRYVLPICEAVGRALRSKQSFHLVILTSTVMPGSTNGEIRTTLEKASGKQAGRDFGLCYSPEFIALGSVIRDFLNPDFVLIGESDARSGALLESLYKRVCQNTPAVARMNIINAEVAKLSVNTFITTKISFANMLARICEALPGANVDVVTSALGLDTRIGGKYLKGAVSYGGPCFPRDNLALAALARRLSVPADLAQATDHFNRGQVQWLAGVVERSLPAGGAAGILGLTYKPQTDVVEQSFGLLLAEELAKRSVRVSAYDPEGTRNSSRALGTRVTLCASARECIDRADVVVLATPWSEFAQIPATQWGRAAAPRTVIDCWRALKHLDGAAGVRYISSGIGAADAQPNLLGAGC
jgi:UDPglucose 6-dehydrogenase